MNLMRLLFPNTYTCMYCCISWNTQSHTCIKDSLYANPIWSICQLSATSCVFSN
jgi:hypothetical protein